MARLGSEMNEEMRRRELDVLNEEIQVCRQEFSRLLRERDIQHQMDQQRIKVLEEENGQLIDMSHRYREQLQILEQRLQEARDERQSVSNLQSLTPRQKLSSSSINNNIENNNISNPLDAKVAALEAQLAEKMDAIDRLEVMARAAHVQNKQLVFQIEEARAELEEVKTRATLSEDRARHMLEQARGLEREAKNREYDASRLEARAQSRIETAESEVQRLAEATTQVTRWQATVEAAARAEQEKQLALTELTHLKQWADAFVTRDRTRENLLKTVSSEKEELQLQMDEMTRLKENEARGRSAALDELAKARQKMASMELEMQDLRRDRDTCRDEKCEMEAELAHLQEQKKREDDLRMRNGGESRGWNSQQDAIKNSNINAVCYLCRQRTQSEGSSQMVSLLESELKDLRLHSQELERALRRSNGVISTQAESIVDMKQEIQKLSSPQQQQHQGLSPSTTGLPSAASSSRSTVAVAANAANKDEINDSNEANGTPNNEGNDNSISSTRPISSPSSTTTPKAISDITRTSPLGSARSLSRASTGSARSLTQMTAEALRRECERLEMELASAEALAAGNSKRVDSLSVRVQQLEQELEEAVAAMTQSDTRQADTLKALLASRREVERLSQLLADMSHSENRLAQEKMEREREYTVHVRSLDVQASAIKHLNSQLALQRDEVARVTSALHGASTLADERLEQLSSMRREREALGHRIALLEADLEVREMEREEHTAMQQRIQDLETNNKMLMDRAERAERECGELRDYTRQLQVQVAMLQEAAAIAVKMGRGVVGRQGEEEEEEEDDDEIRLV